MLSQGQRHLTTYVQAPTEADVSAQIPSKRRQSPRSNANGPRNSVLELPELLEIIFSFLSEREIFAKVQRVSRYWKETIAQSPAAQRSLWLKSQFVNTAVPTSHSGDAGLFLPFGDPRYHSRLNLDPNVPIYEKGVAPNNLLQPFEARREIWHIPAELETLGVIKCTEGEPLDGLIVHMYTFDLPLDLKPQTWHGMYLTEPRIAAAQVKIYSRAPHPLMHDDMAVDAWTTASMWDAGGLTFGSILVVAEKICQTVVPARIRGEYQAGVEVSIATNY